MQGSSNVMLGLLSLLSFLAGLMCFLFPQSLNKLSGVLNRSVATLDQSVLRYRYVVGLLSFLVSYGLYNLMVGGR